MAEILLLQSLQHYLQLLTECSSISLVLVYTVVEFLKYWSRRCGICMLKGLYFYSFLQIVRVQFIQTNVQVHPFRLLSINF
jgi:hypothetical protein